MRAIQRNHERLVFLHFVALFSNQNAYNLTTTAYDLKNFLSETFWGRGPWFQ